MIYGSLFMNSYYMSSAVGFLLSSIGAIYLWFFLFSLDVVESVKPGKPTTD